MEDKVVQPSRTEVKVGELKNCVSAVGRTESLRRSVLKNVEMFSDNASTFKAAAKLLRKLLNFHKFVNSLRKKNTNWVNIPPYSPSQGGSWKSLVKLFKGVLNRVMSEVRRRPTLIPLQTSFSDVVRIVNERPLTSVSSEPNDLAPLTPSCFLGQQLSPYTPISSFHHRGDLRQDYLYNSTLAHKFWLLRMQGYLPTLQGRSNWRVHRDNFEPGQLVLVGDARDLAKRCVYRLGRIHAVHPQIRQGKKIVRLATIAVLKNTGSGEIEYVLRDVAKIAPI